jgi:hypothetical protein
MVRDVRGGQQQALVPRRPAIQRRGAGSGDVPNVDVHTQMPVPAPGDAARSTCGGRVAFRVEYLHRAQTQRLDPGTRTESRTHFLRKPLRERVWKRRQAPVVVVNRKVIRVALEQSQRLA